MSRNSPDLERRMQTPLNRSNLSTPLARLHHQQTFTVDTDTSNFRHTFLSETPPPRPGSQNLSQRRVQEALAQQKRVKDHLTTIQMQSKAPSLVRLYAASITSPHSPPAPLSSEPGKRRAYLEEKASVRQIVDARYQFSTEKNALEPLHIEALVDQVPANAAGKRTVDRRPASSNALILYRERLSLQGKDMVEPEPLPVVCDRPTSPFRSASPRNDPSKVYTPVGVKELLKSCVLSKEESNPMSIVRRQQSEAEASTNDRAGEAEIAERQRREACVLNAVSQRTAIDERMHESLTLLKTAGVELKHGRTPTSVTKTVRSRIGTVRQHLIRKSMSAGEMQSEMSMTMGSQGSQSVPSATLTGKDFSDKDGLLAVHRKGIVKRMYN